jgi:hypothetical protein
MAAPSAKSSQRILQVLLDMCWLDRPQFDVLLLKKSQKDACDSNTMSRRAAGIPFVL